MILLAPTLILSIFTSLIDTSGNSPIFSITLYWWFLNNISPCYKIRDPHSRYDQPFLNQINRHKKFLPQLFVFDLILSMNRVATTIADPVLTIQVKQKLLYNVFSRWKNLNEPYLCTMLLIMIIWIFQMLNNLTVYLKAYIYNRKHDDQVQVHSSIT